MDVVFAGHSFTRRMRDYVIGGRNSDILSDDGAANFAQALQIDNYFRRAYTLSDNIIYSRDLWEILPSILNIQPAILNLSTGSNDLALCETFQPDECLLLAESIMEFASASHVPLIIVNAILPRTGNISSSAEVFRQNATQFNTFIKNYVSVKGTPMTAYNKLRGFTFTYQGAVQAERPVSSWSDDGIHLSTNFNHNSGSTPMDVYIQRIRQDIMSHIGRLTL